MRPCGAGKARNYCTLTLSVGYSVPQCQKQRVDFLFFLFFFFVQFLIKALIGKDKVKREGGVILHLPQYVSNLIKDEQLSVMQVFFFFFALIDFPSTCGIAD